MATTCPFYTKNRCSHTPIALAVFRTKLFRTVQSRETHIGVGGLWGGRDWEEMAFFGALAKGDVSSSIALASREFLPKSCLGKIRAFSSLGGACNAHKTNGDFLG